MIRSVLPANRWDTSPIAAQDGDIHLSNVIEIHMCIITKSKKALQGESTSHASGDPDADTVDTSIYECRRCGTTYISEPTTCARCEAADGFENVGDLDR